MFLNTNKSDRYTTHTTKALMKLSKLISDFKNPEISSIEENIKAFCNYEEQFDDTTMFIIRVK